MITKYVESSKPTGESELLESDDFDWGKKLKQLNQQNNTRKMNLDHNEKINGNLKSKLFLKVQYLIWWKEYSVNEDS